GPEEHQPAVVVGVRLLDVEDRLRRGGVRAVRVGRAHRVSFDARVAGAVGVVHEEVPVGRVVRVECDAEQPALAAARHLGHDVQERRRQELAVLNDPDAPGLLDDEQPRVTRRRGEVNGVGEAGGDLDEPDGLRFAVAVPGSFAGSRHAVAAAERRGEGEDGCERAEAWRVVTAWGRRANEAQRRRRSGYRHRGGPPRSAQMLVPEVLVVVAAAAPGAPRPGAPGRRTRVRLPTIQDPNRRMRQAVRRLTERPGAPGARRRGRVTATLVLTMVLGVAGLVLALRLREPAPPTVSYTELVRGIDDGRVAALEVVPGVGAEGRWAAP